jgi:hypothetical protein
MQHANLLNRSENIFNCQVVLGGGIARVIFLRIHEILLVLAIITGTIVTDPPSTIVIHPLDDSFHCWSIQIEETFYQVSIDKTATWTNTTISLVMPVALVA